jgi:hypothetical protein
VVRENRLDHLLNGLLGVKAKAVIGDVVFVNESNEDLSSPAVFSISS